MVSVEPERWFPVDRTDGFIPPVYPSILFRLVNPNNNTSGLSVFQCFWINPDNKKQGAHNPGDDEGNHKIFLIHYFYGNSIFLSSSHPGLISSDSAFFALPELCHGLIKLYLDHLLGRKSQK